MDDCIDLCSSSEEEGVVPAGGVESESDSDFDENAEEGDDSEFEENGKGHGVNDNGHGKGGVPRGVAESEFDSSEIEEHDKGLGKNTYIGSRCSVKKMYNLIHGLDEEKKGYVKEIGFGGLLLLPRLTRTNRHFVMWLLSKVDEEASSNNVATACEDVLTRFSRKKEEENQRHQAALADLENQSQQQVKNESRKVRDQLKTLFAGIRHQDGVSRNMKGKRPLII